MGSESAGSKPRGWRDSKRTLLRSIATTGRQVETTLPNPRKTARLVSSGGFQLTHAAFVVVVDNLTPLKLWFVNNGDVKTIPCAMKPRKTFSPTNCFIAAWLSFRNAMYTASRQRWPLLLPLRALPGETVDP